LCCLSCFIYVTASVFCSEIYVCVYHGYHSCIYAVTFLLFFVSLLVLAFCRCFCDLSAIHYLLLYAVLPVSCILLYSFFWVVSRCLNFMCRLSEQYVCYVIISGESRTPYTHCNFTMFSVSVHTQIGAVGGAEHTLTIERETGRPTVFSVTVPASVA